MKYPKGLIRYTTERRESGGKTKVLRPRIYIYGALLTALTVLFVAALSMRQPLRVDVIKDRAKLYTITDEGLAENVYTLKIMNLDQVSHRYQIRLNVPVQYELVGEKTIAVNSGEIGSLALRLRIDPYELSAISTKIRFEIEDVDNNRIMVNEESNFIKPPNMSAR